MRDKEEGEWAQATAQCSHFMPGSLYGPAKHRLRSTLSGKRRLKFTEKVRNLRSTKPRSFFLCEFRRRFERWSSARPCTQMVSEPEVSGRE
jgi:hypothetical protein